MRTARMETEFNHGRVPLVVRGSLPNTFWSLGMFVEINLCLCGMYLLSEAIREPLAADQVTVLGAGVILALATFLMIYLVRPKWNEMLAERGEGEARGTSGTAFTAHGELMQTRVDAERVLQENDNLPGPM